MQFNWFKKISFLVLAGLLIIWGIFSYANSPKVNDLTGESPYLNVYNWYGLIPDSILRQFEAETGIRVQYDLFDNNEILETKLLAGKSGYDVVFPSASPYVDRLIRAGALQKLDKVHLPNLQYVDSDFIEHMQELDPALQYSVPFCWGTFGFAYAEEAILARMPDAPVKSYRMLFDPTVVSKFKPCGVALLDEPAEVYPIFLSFLTGNATNSSLDDLKVAQKHFLKIRPFISRFLGQRFANELASGEVCLAQGWSGDAQLAQQQAQHANRKVTIRYVIPEEGGILWIDAICIPKDAPHVRNAHVFINFLLRPDISAALVNLTLFPSTNRGAKPFIKKEILQNESLYPRPEVFRKLKLVKTQNHSYEEVRTRYWFLAKQGATTQEK